MHTKALGFMRVHYYVSILAFAVLAFASVAIADIISGSTSVASSTQVTVTQLSVGAPTSTVSGNILLASIAINGGLSAVINSEPSGWHQISRTDNDSNVTMIAYWKLATASDVGASYVWTINGQTQAEGGITAYSGVNTLNPIDLTATSTGFSQTAVAPSISTSAANEEVVALFATDFVKNANIQYFGPVTGLAQKYNSPNAPYGPSIAAFDAIQTAADVSGSKSSTITGNKNRNWVSQTIALRKASSVIGVDTTSNVGYDPIESGVYTAPLTVGGSDRLLFVTVVLDNLIDSDVITSATFAGQPLTLLKKLPMYYHGSFGNSGREDVYVYAMVAPPLGTNNVSISAQNIHFISIKAVNYTGVRQVLPTNTLFDSHDDFGSPDVLNFTAGPLHSGTNSWAVGVAVGTASIESGNMSGAYLRIGTLPNGTAVFDSNGSTAGNDVTASFGMFSNVYGNAWATFITELEPS